MMSDINCPMCGKVNPADRDTCQYCAARIKPLFPGMDDDELTRLLGLEGVNKKDPLPGSYEDNLGEETPSDWLDKLRSETAHLESSDDESLNQSQDMPRFDDWFNRIDDQDSHQQSNHSVPDSLESVPPNNSSQSNSDGIPDWLSQISSGNFESAQDPESEDWPKLAADDYANLRQNGEPEIEGEADERDDAEPEWLLELEANSPDFPVIDEEASKSATDLFDSKENEHSFNWDIGGDASDHLPVSDQQEDLHTAELPGWLEAMKPVDNFSAFDEKHDLNYPSVEGAGPLAGLLGVIPAEPESSYSRKPFGYSTRLQVSEPQQAHAALLEQLMQSEGKASVISRKDLTAPNSLFRVLVSFLLVCSILVMMILPGLIKVSVPSLANLPSAWAAFQAIEKVQVERPVLLAVDYQPGVSGEMDAVTGAVLKHLIGKKAKLILVTTQPLGAMQAERLIRQFSRETGVQYLPGQDYINLGYIPGGQAGLLGFISDPRRTMPFSIAGDFVWQLPFFQVIQDITDLSLIVVATENTDTARFWIEQLTAYPMNSPLLMAASAQAEPVIAPYYLASPPQVQGILSGLAGAAAYESVTLYPGDAMKNFSPFSVSGLLAVVIILIGSTIGVFGYLMDKRQLPDRNQGAGK